MTVDDAALVARCLAGDERGLRAFVERFQAIVFGLCYRMLGHREDAEDVAQEVFLRAFRHLRHWDARRPLKPWVLAIAANRCRTALQHRARRPRQNEFMPQTISTRDETSLTDLADELQWALDRLRDDYRTCFILFYQQELNCAEIGEILGCPQGTVKTWLHRARRELAQSLQRRGVSLETFYELQRV